MTTQPSLIASMVAALKLSGTERVLEVGTGLGLMTPGRRRISKSANALAAYHGYLGPW